MRFIARAVLWASMLLAAAGCDPATDSKYFYEGAGKDLYTTDGARQAALLNQYIDYICEQAGNCSPTLLVQAGMNDIDQRCDAYLSWLDAQRRNKEPVLAELSAIGTAAHAIMTVSGVGPEALDIVTAAFGLATASYANWNSRLLLAVNQSTVQTVVYSRQQQFRAAINNYIVPDRPYAIYLLRNYLRICMPITIETDINTSTTLVQRGAPMVAERSPVVQAVRPSAIRNVNAPIRRVARSGTSGEPTDPLVVASIRKALCLSEPGGLDDAAHKRLGIYLDLIKQPHSERFFAREMVLLNRLIRRNQTANCSLFK